ncbi:MAG: DUF3455 domain-containing protein [Methyloglobulus sp.]|nr:DUF3455 domain-containing protein [Methyloglobulus sp.]
MNMQQPPHSRLFLKTTALTLFALTTPMIAQAGTIKDILTHECPPQPPTPLPAVTGIAPPAGNQLALTVYATGVQIYTCTSTPATPTTPASYSWVNTAKADLFKNGKKVGKHYFTTSPTWMIEKSEIKGIKDCAVGSPAGSPAGALAAASIPWVRLHATSTPATGGLHNVKFVQRIYTIAGKMSPDYVCDSDHAGNGSTIPADQLRIPYSAHYRFFRAN